jgi:glyoxylase-like metal-dependent hydrolase (beta-lactamase superfamily II)
MFEEIAGDLYRVRIPLPGLSLGFVNSYIVKSDKRPLIIDPGLYHEKSFEVMQNALRKLDINLEKTDYFITHSHGDHIGLVYELVRSGSIVYINELETQTISKIQTGILSSETAVFLRTSGFPEKDPDKIIPPRAIREFKRGGSPPFTFVDDQDAIKRGIYRFTSIETPGHSKGHMCLFEPSTKVLIAGDHLLREITPIVQGRIDGDDPLENYFDSLDKIDQLDIQTVLPGHGDIFGDCKGRIEEIRKHHQERNSEILSILQEKKRNIYEIAMLMTWKTESDTWESMPPTQQYFAAGEAFSHLIYLEKKGRVSRTTKDGEVLYSLSEWHHG